MRAGVKYIWDAGAVLDDLVYVLFEDDEIGTIERTITYFTGG